MISDDEQLSQAIQQLGRLYRALNALKSDVQPLNPRKFALLAEGPLDEIQNLKKEIDEYSGALQAQEEQADVWLHLSGEAIHWPSAPTSVLTSFLDSLRKGVQIVAEYLDSGAVTTRPTQELKEACDLQVVAWEPGSVRVGLNLPEPEQRELNLETPLKPAAKALEDYLKVAAWVDSTESGAVLEESFPDAVKRRLLLNALKPLLPRPRGYVSEVELYGRCVPNRKKIHLSRQANERVNTAIDSTTREQKESHEGDLREIDLDNLTFILRNSDDVNEIRCRFDESMLETAKEALDRRVRVSGARQVGEGRRPSAILSVARLEIIEEDKDTTPKKG